MRRVSSLRYGATIPTLERRGSEARPREPPAEGFAAGAEASSPLEYRLDLGLDDMVMLGSLRHDGHETGRSNHIGPYVCKFGRRAVRLRVHRSERVRGNLIHTGRAVWSVNSPPPVAHVHAGEVAP